MPMAEKSKTRVKSTAAILLGAAPGVAWYFNGGATPSIVVAVLGAFIAFAFTLPEVSAERVARATAGMIVARNMPSGLQGKAFEAMMGETLQINSVPTANQNSESDDPHTYLQRVAGLPAYERSAAVSSHRTRDALSTIGSEEAMQWLERHLDSPVVPAWGDLLYECNPPWSRLEDWIHRDKLHALAAVDALLAFSGVDCVADPRQPRLPDGATHLAIEGALQVAARACGNSPRIREAVRKLNHVWPAGKSQRHPIQIPESLLTAALALFGDDQAMVDRWRDSMATALEAPKDVADMAESLLYFADDHRAIAILDWKAGMEEIVDRLENLSVAKDMHFEFDSIVDKDAPANEVLKVISSVLRAQELWLVALDHGADDYPLAIMTQDRVSRIETTFTALPLGVRVVRF